MKTSMHKDYFKKEPPPLTLEEELNQMRENLGLRPKGQKPKAKVSLNDLIVRKNFESVSDIDQQDLEETNRINLEEND